MEEVCPLPNGHMLYREENGVGGHRYWSDEIGGGVCVWDTALCDASTVLAALTEEARSIFQKENHQKWLKSLNSATEAMSRS